MSQAARVGWGFDAHRLDDEPPLLLGGVEVSDVQGLSATSDGDVLAHAVSDAVLGAAALGDIGQHFPSTSPASAGADSMEILREVVEMSVAAGWKPAHVDVTVVAESIRVGPHREQIRANLAEALGLSQAAVSVKATTTDGLGLIGEGHGMAAIAIVTTQALP